MSRYRAILTSVGALVVAMATTLPLTGCSTLQQAAGMVTQNAPTVQLDAAKAEAIVELAYQGWAASVQQAHAAGLLKGDALVKVKAADNAIYAALIKFRAGQGTAQQVLDTISGYAALVPQPEVK